MKITKNFKTIDGGYLNVYIRLDDDCNNGHNDFAITGEKRDKHGNMETCGCIHDEILKEAPELKTFVDLHLCDEFGIPMHAIANMCYHIKNTKEKVCEYYAGITEKDVEELEKYIEDVEAFEYMLDKLGIIKRWEDLAKKAIKQLEEMTGEKYEYKNEKSTHLNGFDREAIEQKKAKGYFNHERVKERKIKAITEKITNEIEYRENKIKEEMKMEKLKLKLSKVIWEKYFELTGSDYLFDNFILYNDLRLVFNWQNYGKQIKKEHFEKIKKTIQKDFDVSVILK